MDGSSKFFVEALLNAEYEEQSELIKSILLQKTLIIRMS